MNLRAVVASVSLASILWAPAARPQDQKSCAQPIVTTDTKYMPGQVWSFKSRPFELNPTITILKVESLPKIGEVVHIRLDGIRLRNCTGGPEPNHIEHAPFTRAALEASVTQLLRTGVVPDFNEGYSNWLSHCGGVYTISVGEMVANDEKTFNTQFNCAT